MVKAFFGLVGSDGVAARRAGVAWRYALVVRAGSATALRTGRFKATDKLIEMLKAAPNMRSKKTAT